jgi:thymidylate synthase
MNKLDKQYTNLLQDILDNGVSKSDRTGTGTISIFGRQICHKMSDGFPLITTKKMAWKSVVTELLWFLRGDTNIKYLVDNDCHIWDGDAYKNYLKNFIPPVCPPNLDVQPNFYEPMSKEMFIKSIQEKGIRGDKFANKWGDLGPIYGKQWRSWKGKVSKYRDSIDKKGIEFGYNKIDQIANLISELKTNPDSRRLMVNVWNVGELDSMVLPPCHYGFQVYTRELTYEERIKLFEEKTNRSMTYTLSVRETLDSSKIPTRAISLMWNQRSVDTFLGLPFNIASYGLLLEIIAKAVNMVPDELIGNLGDTHLYSNHIEQAKEQIGREFTEEEIQEHLMQSGMDAMMDKPRMEYISKLPKRTRESYPLSTLKHMKTEAFFKSLSEDISLVTHLNNTDFVLENYQSHPPIKAPLSN